MATFASAQDTLSLTPTLTQSPIHDSRWLRAGQSAVLPGWGQATNGEWLRAGTYLAGGIFLAWDALYFWESQYNRLPQDLPARSYDRDIAYGLAVWYGLGALLAAGDAYYGASQRWETRPTRAAFRSVFFPGWGQLANGKRWKALIIFAGQTTLGFAAYTQHERYIFHRARNEISLANFYLNDRNRLLWWSVGAVIYSGFDAFVDCHLRDWNVSEDLTLAPTYFPQQKAAGFSFQMRFSAP